MKSVKIGHQEWSSENLNVDHFNNGDEILLFISFEYEDYSFSFNPVGDSRVKSMNAWIHNNISNK